MSDPRKRFVPILIMLLASLATVPPLRAEDKPKEGWSDVTELSYVATSGNSESNTLGFKSLLKRTWTISSFELKAGAVRARSTATTWSVNQTTGAIDKESTTTVAAENYYLNGRYDRNITEKLFWYAGAGWERNLPAGIESKYWEAGGLGNIWSDTETVKFRTDYSVTYSQEKDVVEPPDFNGNFLGARFSWVYLHKFGANTTYGNDFTVDENLDKTTDYRGDMTNWVAVTMSQRLALKVSLQWLYRHEPSFTEAPDPGNVSAANPDLVQLDSLDSIFMASLVMKF